MSAKTQFLKKLYAQSVIPPFSDKTQADIAAFYRAMEQLQDQMVEWLAETGIQPESATVPVTDLLVESGAFDIPGMTLRYEKRRLTFIPLFLYGHGVTGCVEASLYSDGKVTPLSRLFMRAGNAPGWSCTRTGSLSRPERSFDENTFFELMEGLLP